MPYLRDNTVEYSVQPGLCLLCHDHLEPPILSSGCAGIDCADIDCADIDGVGTDGAGI